MASTKQESKYCFPLLSYAKIFEACRDCEELAGLRIAKTDFTNPEINRWRQIFSTFVEIFTSMSLDEIIQRRKLFVPGVSDLDTYNQFLEIATFKQIMDELLRIGGLPNICFTDLIVPAEGKKLQKIISCLLNMQKYQAVHRSKTQVIEETCETACEESRQLEERINEYKERINVMLASKPEMDAENTMLLEKIEEHQRYLQTLPSVETYNEQFNDLNESINAKRLKNDTLDIQIAQMTNHLESLKTKIVPSPEQYQMNIDNLEIKNAEKAAALADLKKQLRVKQMALAQKRSQKKQNEDILAIVDTIDALNTEQTKLVENAHGLDKEINDLRSQLVTSKQANENQSVKQQQLEDDYLKLLSDKTVENRKQHKANRIEYLESLQQARQDYDVQELIGWDEKIKDLQNELEETLENKEHLKALIEQAHNKTVSDFIQYKTRVEDSVKCYVEDLL